MVDLDDGSQVVARTAESSDPISDKRCLVLPENEVGAIGCSDSGNIITSIAFASFGTPEGDCTGELGNSSNTFSVNKSCHASASAAAIEDLCLNQSSCTLAPVCHDQTCRIGANSSGAECGVRSGGFSFECVCCFTFWLFVYVVVSAPGSLAPHTVFLLCSGCHQATLSLIPASCQFVLRFVHFAASAANDEISTL